MRRDLVWLLIPSVFAADRILKIQVLSRIREGESIPVWPGVFHLTRVENAGAAFGLWRGASFFLTVFSVVSVTLILAYLAGAFGNRVRHAPAWTFVAGGALGNLYDRLLFGHVIDYLDFRVWPVFNFADACISLGVAWILIRYARSHASGPV